MGKTLVIATTHFGTNFSGGSTATCEIFGRLQHRFEEIYVLGTQLGEHPFNNLHFVHYRSWAQAIRILKEWHVHKDAIFYGDFYNAILLVWAQVPFYFTYHDSWPELGALSWRERVRGWWYNWAYRTIFRRAKQVFSVSEHKKSFISRYTKRVECVRNGFTRTSVEVSEEAPKNIIMVGNLNANKYRQACKFFKRWQPPEGVEIHIYGRTIDNGLARLLDRFSFIRLMGHRSVVRYGDYRLLLHTAMMENLPLVFGEAVYHNVPVVAFNVGGSADLVTADHGILCAAYDLQEMGKAVAAVLHGMWRFSRCPRLLEEYSWETASVRYAKVMGLEDVT